MGIITIRSVPEEVKAALRDRAKRHHRSMEKEALAVLSEAVGIETAEEAAKRQRQEEAIARLKAAHQEMGLWRTDPDWRFDREAFYNEDMKERGLL